MIRTQVKWRIKQHWDYDRETRPQAEERPPGNAGAEDRHHAGDTGEVHRNADQKASRVVRQWLLWYISPFYIGNQIVTIQAF